MKKALNAWTLEDSLTMEEAFAAAADAGFAALELNVDTEGKSPHALSLSTDKAEYARIRSLSRQYGIPVASISTSLWGGMMGDPAQWEDARKLLDKQLEAAAALGADGILVVPGGIGGDITLAAARRNSIAFLRENRKRMEDSGIFVGVENVWNGFFLSPYDMASFIDEVDSPAVGAYLDVGNMLALSEPEYWVEVLGSRIGKIHVKDYKRNRGILSGGEWVDVTHGSAKWNVIIPALRKAGYDGYLVGEVFRADPELPYPDYYKKVSGEIGQLLNY